MDDLDHRVLAEIGGGLAGPGMGLSTGGAAGDHADADAEEAVLVASEKTRPCTGLTRADRRDVREVEVVGVGMVGGGIHGKRAGTGWYIGEARWWR